jgi:hypothetical protein
MNTTKWRALILFLRTKWPISCPVVVRRYPSKKVCGRTVFDGGRFRICVSTLQDGGGQKDTLLHEWAHAYAIDQAYHHDARWGAIYSDIYSTWEKDFT